MQTERDINKKIYIIILNWNGWSDTISCLESVFRNDYTNYQVIVCDNDSQDNSLEYIKTWAEGCLDTFTTTSDPLRPSFFPPVNKPISYVEYDRAQAEAGGDVNKLNRPLIIIRNCGNLGFAGGNNVGIRYAQAVGDFDYVWLLNNDTAIAHDALTSLVKVAECEKMIGIVGSKINYYSEPKKIWFAGGSWRANHFFASHIGLNEADVEQANEMREVDFITGCSLLIKSQTINEIGLMPDEYFLYWEDTAWNDAASVRGWKVFYVPKSLVWHKNATSTKDDSYSFYYYFIRNCLLFYQRHAPDKFLLIFAYIVYLALVKLARGKKNSFLGFKDGVLDFCSKRFGENCRY